MLRFSALTFAFAAVLAAQANAATDLTEAQARTIVAPFYDALNKPATKDLQALFDQATSPDWVSCGGNETCLPRERVIAAFKQRGSEIPNLMWTIKEIVVVGNRVIVRGEGSGTPADVFLGVKPNGKSFRVMAIDVHTIEGGKMVRSFHVEDWAGAIRQLSAP